MIRVKSITIPQLLHATDENYLHRKVRLSQLKEPQLLKVFANTAIFRVPSSKFSSNQTYWHVYVLFQDLRTIASDKEIPLDEAVKYAIREGDVHIADDCPAHRYWAFEYYATQLDYAYGPYQTNMAPTKNNTQMRSMICKHTQKVFEWLNNHISEMAEAFSTYYSKIRDKKTSEVKALSMDKDTPSLEEASVTDQGTTYVPELGRGDDELVEESNTDSNEDSITETDETEGETDESILGSDQEEDELSVQSDSEQA